MTETTLEFVKRNLDSEIASEALHPLPSDFYARVSTYSQKLKRSAGSGTSEASIRLISRQLDMIASMSRQLLGLRVKKAATTNALLQLLPEERYVCLTQQGFRRRFDAFIQAISAGQPSFIEFTRRSETSRNVAIRILKHTDELVGADLKRYGPFEVGDLVSIPAANADILIAGGEAIEIHTREE